MTEHIVGRVRVSRKNQVTLTKTVRVLLDVKPGDTIEYVFTNGAILLRKARGEGDDQR